MERLGGFITYTSSLAPPFLLPLEHPMFSLSMQILILFAELGGAVVLLVRAVVLQDLAVVPPASAVVPQGPTVVPLMVSGSTVVPA